MSDDEREATWSRCRSRRGADGDPKSRTRRPYYVAHYLAPPPPPPPPPPPASSPDPVASSAIPRSSSATTPSSARSSSAASSTDDVRDAEPERTFWFRWWRRGGRTRPPARAPDANAADRGAARTASPESSDRDSRRLTDRVASDVAPRSAAPSSMPSSLAPPPPPPPLSGSRRPAPVSSQSSPPPSPSPRPPDRLASRSPPSVEALRSTAGSPEPVRAVTVSGAERKNVTEPEADESAATSAGDGDGVTETQRAPPRKGTKKRSAASGERKRGREERAPSEPKRFVARDPRKSRARRAEVGTTTSPAPVGERKTKVHEATVTPTDRDGVAERKTTRVSQRKKRKPQTTAIAPEKGKGGLGARVDDAAAGSQRGRDENENISEEDAEEGREAEEGRDGSDDEHDRKLTKEREEEEEEEEDARERRRASDESEAEADDAPSETLRDERRKISRGDTSNASQKHEDGRDVETTASKVFDADRRANRVVHDDGGALARLADRRRPKKPPTTPPRGCFRKCVGGLCCCCCCCCSPTASVRSRVCWSIAIGTLAVVGVVALAILAHHWRNDRNWAEARRDMSEWGAQDVRRIAGANMNDAVWATAGRLERATASVRAAWWSYGATSSAPLSPPPTPSTNAQEAAAVTPEHGTPAHAAFPANPIRTPSLSPAPPAAPLVAPADSFASSVLSLPAPPPPQTVPPPPLQTVPLPPSFTLGPQIVAALDPANERGASEISAPPPATDTMPATAPTVNSPSDKKHDPTPAVASASAAAAAARRRSTWRQHVRLSTEFSPNHRTAGCLVLILTLFAAVRAATAVGATRRAAPTSPTPLSTTASNASTCVQCASIDASLKNLAQLVGVDRLHVASPPASVAVGPTLGHACRDARLVMRMWEWVVVRRQDERQPPTNRYVHGDSFGVDLHLVATDAALGSAAAAATADRIAAAADDDAISYDADTQRARVTWRVATETLGAAEVEDEGDDDGRDESKPWRALDIASALVRLESRSVSVTVAVPSNVGDRRWWCVEQWVDVVLAPLLREFSAAEAPRRDAIGDDVDNLQLAAVHVRMMASSRGALVLQCVHRVESLGTSPLSSSPSSGGSIRSPRVEIPCDQLTDSPAIEALRRLFAGHAGRRKTRT